MFIEEEFIMGNKFENQSALERLLKKYKKMFRIPENLDYYSKEDYETAEKKFIKYYFKNSCS